MTEDDKTLGPNEAARMLRVGPSTIQRWIDAGEIPAYRTLGGHRRIQFADLVAFASARGMPLRDGRGSPAPSLLIVDDEQDLLDTLSVRVRGLRPEIEVHVSRSGFEAGLLVQRHRPGLVLLDIRMPGVNGVTVCRRIREDPQIAATRVVGLTASREPSEIQALLEAGAEQVFFKPLEVEQLALLLDLVFPRARGAPAQEREQA